MKLTAQGKSWPHGPLLGFDFSMLPNMPRTSPTYFNISEDWICLTNDVLLKQLYTHMSTANYGIDGAAYSSWGEIQKALNVTCVAPESELLLY